MSPRAPIYLDHHATTPLDPRVLELVHQVQRDHFGNAGSAGHAYGWAAAKLVEQAREKVAALINASPAEMVFTSGATEADNLALLGLADAWEDRPGQVVTSTFEHEAVAGPVAELDRRGWRVARVGPDPGGVLECGSVEAVLTADSRLVTVMAAQNEIGTIQPLAEMGRLCKDRGVLFMTDAAQAAGRIPLDVQAMGIDLLALSSHKIHGPKGAGALFVRRRDPRVVLRPRQFGGGQEGGLRPGTLDVPAIAGFGEACRLAAEGMADEAARLSALRDDLWQRISTALEGVTLNGCPRRRLPGNLNFSVAGVPSHRLLAGLTTLAVSSGSACSSGSTEPSPVLLGLGVPADLARCSLRIGLGRFTTAEEIAEAGDRIIGLVRKLRGAAS
ncbi:cysteine desulfurase [bacterium]|nr:cysteine desulfurase [bacterium]